MARQYYDEDDLEDDDDFEDEDDEEDLDGDGPICPECDAPVATEGQLCAQCIRWADGSNRWPR